MFSKISGISRQMSRNQEQIRYHYNIEKSLAKRLKNAKKANRARMYNEVYDELFMKVPNHPQLNNKNPAARARKEMRLISRYLGAGDSFLEIGCGDSRVSIMASRTCRQVYAIDVSEKIISKKNLTGNMRMMITNGRDIPLPPNSIDLAYSNQLTEHLHPDDAVEQLSNIYTTLKPGGRYICITPNKATGPHDVSKYFNHVAEGFHLKEYSLTELKAIFQKAGFRDFTNYVGGRGIYFQCPGLLVRIMEEILFLMPQKIRKIVSRLSLTKAMLGLIVVAKK